MAAAFRAESVRSDSSSALSSAESSSSKFMRRKGLQSSANTTTANTTPASIARHYATEESEAEHKTANRRYRDSTEAPDTFKEQTQILFEEGIYDLAIQSLQTNLFSQSYQPVDTPWWVAPPAHIAFLGTLVVHPLHTTWARDDGKNKKIVAVRAYQYLLDVLRSVGPINGHFKTAFAFRDRASRAGRRRRHSPEESDVNQEDDLNTPLADADSLWNRVPDFWTMLGWAFSCAASHPERWVHWKLWVELLLDVMERDLEERKALDDERGDEKSRMLRESIIVSYIGEHQLGHIMRVLFAYLDGDSPSYQEIWPKETQSPTATNKRKRDIKVDLEHDEYGDWFESEEEAFEDEDIDDDGASASTTPAAAARKRGKGRARKRQLLPLVESPLLEETIPIRRRIFTLVSQICYELPDDDDAAPFAIYDLYERFAEHVRGLPLDAFPHFVWSDMPVAGSVYVTLARHVLSYLLPPGVPQPVDVDGETEAKGYVSAAMMERCFLPFATNSVVEDNARLAVVLWELLSYLWRAEEGDVGPRISEGMRRAIVAGLEQRERKSKVKSEGGPDGGTGPGWVQERMEVIEKDRYAPANVLRLAHLKFRLLLETSDRREALGHGERWEADLLGWK